MAGLGRPCLHANAWDERRSHDKAAASDSGMVRGSGPLRWNTCSQKRHLGPWRVQAIAARYRSKHKLVVEGKSRPGQKQHKLNCRPVEITGQSTAHFFVHALLAFQGFERIEAVRSAA